MRHGLPTAAVFVLTTLLAACGPQAQLPPTAAPAPTVAPTAAPAPTVAPTPADVPGRLDQMFTNLAAKNLFTGTVLIRQGDTILLREGYGYADREAKIPNTPTTVYQIGHASKSMTAFGLLLLEAQGKLNVEDPLCSYLDDCPAAWAGVKLHHLMSNSSGIPPYLVQPGQVAAPAELLTQVRERPLLFEPGSTWDGNVSNSNGVLMGMVIERAAGKPYELFMREEVFAPLGMTSTGLTGAPAELAKGYLSKLAAAERVDPSVTYAGYGLYSTADDLYRFGQALLDDTLLPEAQRKGMLAADLLDVSNPDWGYGYGTILTDTYLEGHSMVVASAPWTVYPGFWNSIWILTDNDTTVIILTNQEYGYQMDPFSDTVASILLGRP